MTRASYVDMKQRLIHLIRMQASGFLFWSIISGALALMLITLLAKIFFSGHALNKYAFEVGQRVIVHIRTNETEGTVRHTLRATQNKPSVNTERVEGSEGLAPAPFAAITAESEKGLIPIIGRDGTTSWKYYGRPYSGAPKRPLVAVTITNLGLSKSLTEEALKLPHTFTLSFSPYASDAKEWARKARKEGFESLVDIPMEQTNYPLSDPGPYGILGKLSTNDKSTRLHWVLSRFAGFVGVLAPQNEKLTADLTILRPILTELAARGVLFLYIKNSQNAPLAELAKSHTLTALGMDMVIDDTLTPSALDAQLQKLTMLAKTQNVAIGIAHSYPVTLEALSRWADTLSAEGVDLVPVSAIAARTLP